MLQNHYLAQRDQIRSVIQMSGATGSEAVAACPGWSVADVVRHLLGLVDNWLTGDLEVYASPEWTSRQVDSWSHSDLDELVDTWVERSDRFVGVLDNLDAAEHLPRTIMTVIGPVPTKTFASGIVVDLTQHCYDIADSLDSAPSDPIDTVGLLTPTLLAGVSRRWRKAGHDPTQILSSDTGLLGVIGDREATCSRSVTASTVEIFRAFGGRRSALRLQALDWDPSPPEPTALQDFVVPFFALPDSSAAHDSTRNSE